MKSKLLTPNLIENLDNATLGTLLLAENGVDMRSRMSRLTYRKYWLVLKSHGIDIEEIANKASK